GSANPLVAPLLLFFKQQLTNKLELFLQSSQYLSQLLTGINYYIKIGRNYHEKVVFWNPI
ncbi:hypothetical protein, partial [Silvanigrella sp.]|uniref:hypothetical protein n=1 Tax=Silvanigrella sp. TaxID=2024976 RepID=UPI0037C69474